MLVALPLPCVPARVVSQVCSRTRSRAQLSGLVVEAVVAAFVADPTGWVHLQILAFVDGSNYGHDDQE